MNNTHIYLVIPSSGILYQVEIVSKIICNNVNILPNTDNLLYIIEIQ